MPFYLPNTGGLGLSAPFRGDWQDPAGTLLWSTKFDSDNDLTHWVQSFTGVSTRTLDRTLVDSGDVYGFTNKPMTPNTLQWQVATNSTSQGTGTISLTFSDIPELAGKTLSKVEFDIASVKVVVSNNNTSLTTKIRINGIDVREVNPSYTPAGVFEGWFTYTGLLTGTTDVLSIISADTASSYSSDQRTFITNMAVYGSATAAEQYMFNDVVIHNGSAWRSKFNFNIEEPGTGDQWKQATLTV